MNDNLHYRSKKDQHTTTPEAGWRRVIIALSVTVLPVLGLLMFAQSPTPDNIDRPRQTITPTIPTADRNQEDKVFLEHADFLTFDKPPAHFRQNDSIAPPEEYQILTGNVKFRKGGMIMYCDSAHFYETSNSFDAYGNVRMEQGDTLFVFSDELEYDGAEELAVLYANPGKKVRLINRDVELKTDVFNYSLSDSVGFYNVGGILTDKSNRLDSWEGEYYPSTKEANFFGDVKLTGLNESDTLRMLTDTLYYNTDTHIAEIVTDTHIISKDGDIYSTSGTYNTETGIGDLYKRSFITTKRGNTLTGDTLFYNRDLGIGEAFGNMIFTDSARQSSMHGNYGYYNDPLDSCFVTGRALAKEYSQGDTLYLHGDTINAYLVVDGVDSVRITNAFHRVRFFRSDIQGLCDSISMSDIDSIMYMYRHPIIWSDERQIFGNVIHIHLNDSTVDWARLPEFGFAAEHIAEDCFNQLSGSDMTAWFNDSTISRLYVEGNVEMLSFPMENDSTYNKFAILESSYMDVYFNADTIESAHFWPETTTKITPLYLAKRTSYFLPKFKWYEILRPTDPADVFNISQEMIDLLNSADVAPKRKMAPKQPLKPNPDAPNRTDISKVTSDSISADTLHIDSIMSDSTNANIALPPIVPDSLELRENIDFPDKSDDSIPEDSDHPDPISEPDSIRPMAIRDKELSYMSIFLSATYLA